MHTRISETPQQCWKGKYVNVRTQAHKVLVSMRVNTDSDAGVMRVNEAALKCAHTQALIGHV